METVLKTFNPRVRIDWFLLLSIAPILLAGLVTMNSFVDSNPFFDRQLIWIAVSLLIFFSLSFVDFRFLRRTNVLMGLFGLSLAALALLLAVARTVRGAQSWFHFGFFSFEPADFITLVLVFILAKYFSRRHIEIAHIRHIVVSGFYAFALFVLVMLEPDFGSAIVIFCIWFGMVLVSGISKKHLLMVFLIGMTAFGGLWGYVFKEYQKERILNFFHPLAHVQGSGYNAYQSTIAVGSGELLGKGAGFGTQSRLKFLPEYQTDFIFAAFAEEWGFLGVLILFIMYGFFISRVLASTVHGATNFEILFGLGLAIFFISHFAINIGMNIGLLPVTGITLPFMSYGGTHLFTEFAGLGILMGMRRYGRAARKEATANEVVGV